jgi:hypothetical protein
VFDWRRGPDRTRRNPREGRTWRRITLATAWAQFAYFLAAGLLWVIPAGLLIRWMQRPD